MMCVESPHLRLAVLCCALILQFATAVLALSSVDPTFIPVPSRQLDLSPNRRLVMQPDGKMIVVGGWNAADGKAKGQVFRLNADGTVDNSFGYCSCALPYTNGAMLGDDGKLILFGATGLASAPFAKMVRLLTDGSVDSAFSSTETQNATQYYPVGIQSDGKILAMRVYGGAEWFVYRFYPDGTKDLTFSPISYGSTAGLLVAITGYKQLIDGRFFLADNAGIYNLGQYNGHVRLFNANGNQDSSFSPPVFNGTAPNGGSRVNSIGLMSDGTVIAAGDFNTVNGVASNDIAHLFTAGNVDLTFSGATSNSIDQVRVISGNNILVSGSYPTLGSVIRRYTSTGTLDGTFTMSSSLIGVKSNFDVEASGRIVLIGGTGPASKYYRLESTGALDLSYNPNATAASPVSAAAVRSDGKVYVSGTFEQVNGVAQAKFTRLNADGTLDSSFLTGTGFNAAPSLMIVQADGRVIACGSFSTYNGTSRSGIARINNDGSLDTSFTPTVSGVHSIALQSDGKVLIGGSFSTVNGISRPLVARLNSDGTLDVGFSLVISGSDIVGVIAQTDGKTVIAGTFSGVDGFNRANVARLLSSGGVDTSFDAGSQTANLQVMRQSTGKYVLRNNFIFTRLNTNGSADNTFVFPQFNSGASVTTAAVDTDDSIVVSGQFSAVAGYPRQNIARFSANGDSDTTFLYNGIDIGPSQIIPAPSSKMLLIGSFNVVDSSVRSGIARLNIDPYHAGSKYDFDGDGRADEMVFRPSQNYWYLFQSSDSTVRAVNFGQAGDLPIPTDISGDGTCELVIFRPSSGDWYWTNVAGNQGGSAHWGQNGDIPMPSDVDFDRRSDFVVYRPSNGYWYTYGSLTGFSATQFGAPGDKPVVADLDGDGKYDPTIFRPSSGDWWWRSSIDGVQRALHWGQNGDIPVPADYDGDGKTDCAVFRPSNGGWYVLNSRDLTFYIIGFGISEDKPVSADYDGDGKADIAVFRPSSGVWYLWRSTAGFGALQFGAAEDKPAPNTLIQP